MIARFPRALLFRIILYAAAAALIVGAGMEGIARERVRTAAHQASARTAAERIAAIPPPPERAATLVFAGDIMLSRAVGRIMASEGDWAATLVFAGDIMLSRAVGRIMASEGDWSYPFREIRDELSAADLTVGNLEGPISDRGAHPLGE